MHELKMLNADPHPGNFLFRMDGSIGVLDFGCTKKLTPKLYEDYFRLADPTLFEDRERAKEALLAIEILRTTDEGEREDYLIELFARLIGLISRPYHEGRFNFADDSFYEEMTELGMEISELKELRGTKDFLFINKTYYGLFGLFHELGVELNTVCKYHNFLRAQ
jgi:predicted unusual protein kinase regulating ubiquinone biosynthesis (AarF/ABC1/UbiB family)